MFSITRTELMNLTIFGNSSSIILLKFLFFRLKNNNLRNTIIKIKALKNKIFSVVYIIIKDESKS
jgi:hypothetical protein